MLKRVDYFVFILLGTYLFSCSTNLKEPSANVDSLSISKIETADNLTQDYVDIKESFNKGYYFSLLSSISDFVDKYPESIYADSVKIFRNQIESIKNKESKKRDSLSKYSAVVYFKNLGLPTLDSITEKNYKLSDHDCNYDFSKFDTNIIKTSYEHTWYLSLQNMGSMTCVTVCHYFDCENNISLYAIDSLFNIRSSKRVYFNGCIGEPTPDFPFNGYVINEHERTNWTTFNNDKTFTVVDRIYFILKDVKTGKSTIEIGRENNITYRLNSEGKFIVTTDKSFKKDYVDPLYKVPV